MLSICLVGSFFLWFVFWVCFVFGFFFSFLAEYFLVSLLSTFFSLLSYSCPLPMVIHGMLLAQQKE